MRDKENTAKAYVDGLQRRGPVFLRPGRDQLPDDHGRGERAAVAGVRGLDGSASIDQFNLAAATWFRYRVTATAISGAGFILAVSQCVELIGPH